jgi:hypothetical protein
MSSPTDLQHRDWLLSVTIKIVQNIDQQVSWKIIDLDNNRKHLELSNISENTLDQLYFITNTDINNNYLYLEDMKVYLTSNLSNPLDLTGLSELAKSLWNNSDSIAFINGNKTHTPFKNALTFPYSTQPMSISSYVDIQSSIVPFFPTTIGLPKVFTIILNPDLMQTPI